MNMASAGAVLGAIIVLVVIAIGVSVLLSLIFSAVSDNSNQANNTTDSAQTTNVTEQTAAAQAPQNGAAGTITSHETWTQRKAEWSIGKQAWMQKHTAHTSA